MTATGWTGEDVEGPALPVTEMLLRNRERGPGDTLAIALARGRALEARELREEAAAAPDPDEYASALVNRGYTPSMAFDLGQRLGDTLAELQGEREKIERGQRRAEQVRRAHANGQITAFDIARMDLDEGDPGKVARLERRAESLRREIREASAMIAPQREQVTDGVEAATRSAHAVFVEATRQRMAQAQAGVRPVRRPFAYATRSGAPGEPTCGQCIAVGATLEESSLIHGRELGVR